MPPTIAAVPQFVSGAQTYTPSEPTEAVAMQLGMRAKQYRPSKPTSLARSLAISRRCRLHSGTHHHLRSPPSHQLAQLEGLNRYGSESKVETIKERGTSHALCSSRPNQACISGSYFIQFYNESDPCFRHLKLGTDQLTQTINHI
eukprot:scaffold240595_cov63-Attheya_sp.AAC.1